MCYGRAHDIEVPRTVLKELRNDGNAVNFARSQAGVTGMEKGAVVPLQQEQGIRAFASK